MFVGIIHDITSRMELMTQLSEAIKKLSHQASTDELTGLQNRRSCYQEAKHMWSLAQRNEKPLAALMIDIDHFKSINDHYGHDAGDEVLKVLANSLTEHSRDEDVVCRYGGEEFLILSYNHTKDELKNFAQRLIEETRKLSILYQEHTLHITISIGITVAEHDHFENIENLISEADHLLYKAKNNGRNRIELNAILTDHDTLDRT